MNDSNGVISFFSEHPISKNIIYHSLGECSDPESAYLKLTAQFLELEQTGKTVLSLVKSDNLPAVAGALKFGFNPSGLITFKDPCGTDVDVVELYYSSTEPGHESFTPFPQEGLSDGVLTLRISTRPDGARMFQDHYDSVTRFWSIYPDIPFSQFDKDCRLAGLYWLLGKKMMLSIFENNTQELIGRISLRPVVPPMVGDVGYGVFSGFRGKGYASQALKMLSDWLMTDGGFNRLELGVKPENVASKKVALKAGYIHEGISRSRLINQDGTFSDQLSYVKTKP
ncbi:GNAT family N-acetyltransferase [Providencia sp. PROV255]|uniref:GNAT family N-acetyltransferase n=1 Tax=Providencia sp. PROV255 TaxID=2949943 RepID=UPI00234B0A1E|nr:GNAT family protein [Providencia sp. PROV255]